MADFLRLVVTTGSGAGTVLNTWDNYSFSNDLFTPADPFNLSLSLTERGSGSTGVSTRRYFDKLRALTVPETVVRLEIGEAHDLVSTGVIDDQFIHGDRASTRIDISGRDGIGLLQDNECDPKIKIENQTLPQIADQILSKYRGRGIAFGVEVDNTANRDILTGKSKPLKTRTGAVSAKTVTTSVGQVEIYTGTEAATGNPSDQFVKLPIAEARPHPGEREYEFLDRHAKNVGVMMTMTATGNLVFFRPDYELPVLFKLQRLLGGADSARNNILSGGARRNTANAATSMRLLGHKGTDDDGNRYQVSSAALLAMKYGSGSFDAALSMERGSDVEVATVVYGDLANVAGFSLRWPRNRTVRDSHAKDGARALRIAKRELALANTNLLTCEYTVQGHGQNGILYCPDTLCRVVDEKAGIDGVFYITSRTITKSAQGTFTVLKLVPKGAIVL